MKKNFSPSHDYILVYGRDANVIETNGITRTAETDSSYGNLDNDPRGDWRPDNLSVGPAIRKYLPSHDSLWESGGASRG